MSKYLTFSDITLASLPLLIAALADCGYTEVEQGANLPLNGWGNQNQTADVVIRKAQIGATFGDVGFKKTEAGYVPVIDDLDLKRIHGGKFLPSLRTAYHERLAQQLARNVHGTIQRQVQGKTIKIKIRC